MYSIWYVVHVLTIKVVSPNARYEASAMYIHMKNLYCNIKEKLNQNMQKNYFEIEMKKNGSDIIFINIKRSGSNFIHYCCRDMVF